MATQNNTPAQAGNNYDRKSWSIPSRRAKGYADDRKAKVHTYGPNQGQQLKENQLSFRSGYLQCQNDHSSYFKYTQAKNAGFSKTECAELARKPWKEVQTIIEKKGGKK